MAVGSPGGTFRHPDELRIADMVAQASMEIGDQFKDTKAAPQQEHMMMEFFQFCNKVYPHDQYAYTLNCDKVNRFMLYQALKEQKPKGGTKESREATKAGIFFDYEDYKRVVESIDNAPTCAVTRKKIYPEPQKPPGAASFNGYKAILKKIYKYQVARRVQQLPWDHIWQVSLDELHKHVKERKAMVDKQNYEEKVNSEFQPFEIPQRYGELEETMFQGSYCNTRRSICGRLRHRFCVNYLTAGLLRTESLYSAEMSDFQGFDVPKLNKDVDAPYLMINQIPKRKTTQPDLNLNFIQM